MEEKKFCCDKFHKFYVEAGEGDMVVMGNPLVGFVRFDLNGLNFKRFMHKAEPHLVWAKTCPWCGKKLKSFYGGDKI